MIARILDMLFIQIPRAWAAGPDAEPNWLAGALDPQIGLALSAVHRDPGHDWAVGELAHACCLPGRRSLPGSPPGSECRQPPISRMPARTPPPACSATPPFRSAHRGEGRLHVGGGIQPRVQPPLRHAAGTLAARHTNETFVSDPRAARSARRVPAAPARRVRRETQPDPRHACNTCQGPASSRQIPANVALRAPAPSRSATAVGPRSARKQPPSSPVRIRVSSP
jgi:hypothetical protein